MASFMESQLPTPSSGYSDGIDENGRVDTSVIDKTNGMIIGAALYATNNLPSPTPTPIHSSPTDNTTPSPSVVQPGVDTLESWFVLSFVVGIIVVGCILIVKSIVDAIREKSNKLPLY